MMISSYFHWLVQVILLLILTSSNAEYSRWNYWYNRYIEWRHRHSNSATTPCPQGLTQNHDRGNYGYQEHLEDRMQDLNLDFQSLSDCYKTAFMSVDDLIGNSGLISPPGPNEGNVHVVFDNQTQKIMDLSLEPMVSNILPTIVPGTWRAMTYIQGCCPVLRYHAANETLTSINGERKRIVHFSRYDPPMYQFIPHGLCVQNSYSTHGHCIQGTITMSLLVYDLRFIPPLSFDMFSIPSYCNCVQL